MSFGRRWSQADIDALRNGKKAEDKAKGNAKIKNATRTKVGAIEFASKLELYCYNMLNSVGIKFDFQYLVILQEKFRHEGKMIREIKMIPDFYLPDYDLIIDTKGFATEASKLKFKLLKYKFHLEGKKTKIELPRTQKEVDAIILQLISEKPKV